MSLADLNALKSRSGEDSSSAPWMPIESAPRDGKSGKFLVTNNLRSMDANGNMSHLWLVAMVHKEKGRFIAFEGDSWHKVENLTHWIDLNALIEAAMATCARINAICDKIEEREVEL